MRPEVTVCHLTTVHPAKDPRIFQKECVSLAAAGYDVTLIVANGKPEEDRGVKIVGVPVQYHGRLQRIRQAPKAVYRKAMEVNADIYHFHDPEFLPYAAKLKKKGKIVVYDAHEDLPRQVLSKYYLPAIVRKTMSKALEWYENRTAKKLDYLITATDFIKDRFCKINPQVGSVKNFPLLNEIPEIPSWESRKDEVAYVGVNAGIRGVKEMVKAMEYTQATLNLGGNFNPPELEKEVSAYEGWKNVNALGFIDRDQVKEVYAQSKIGLVTLHPTINYQDALAVKMFEYMGNGMAVIASDFPLWKGIINKHQCGICVNPLDPKAIAGGINYLLSHQEEAKAMGENGRKAVLEKYNWSKEEEKLLKIYNGLSKLVNK